VWRVTGPTDTFLPSRGVRVADVSAARGPYAGDRWRLA
jgi:hypothetical protein